MWQQSSYQQWAFAPQQSSQEIDWGALAQAWRQNKEMNPAQQTPVNPGMANNMTNMQPPQFPAQQMQWPQPVGWQNQQWNNNAWNNPTLRVNYNPQQWHGTQQPSDEVPNMLPPHTDAEPPLPPLPPEEASQGDGMSELPPGVDLDPDSVGPSQEDQPTSTFSDDKQQSSTDVEVSVFQQEETPPGYHTPPPIMPSHPPMKQEFPGPPKPEGQWTNDWKPPMKPDNWGVPPRGMAPTGTQWNGGGNMPPWYGNGQMNQFPQGQGMMNNSMGQTIDQSKRKALPAWIREGLERMEQEKQKQSEKEQVSALRNVTKGETKPRNDSASKSKFESDSESDAELPQEEEVDDVKDVEAEAQPGISEEEKNELLVLKVRKMLTEVLLDVTNTEIQAIAQNVYKKASKAPAKQLARSSALSSIGHIGVVDGYSSDEDSGNDYDDGDSSGEKEVDDGDENSADEDEVQRKVEAFHKKQMVRLKMLEDAEAELSAPERKSEERNVAISVEEKLARISDHVIKESSIGQSVESSDENVTSDSDVKLSAAKPDRSRSQLSETSKSKIKSRRRSPSDSTDELQAKRLSYKRHKSPKRTPPPMEDRELSSKKSKLSKKTHNRSRSRSKDRKHSSRKASRTDSSSSKHRRKRSSSPKLSSSSSPKRSPKRRERSFSKRDASPDHKKSVSRKKDIREGRSRKRDYDVSSDDSVDRKKSRRRSTSDSSEYSSQSRKKKSRSKKKKSKKKHSKKRSRRSSSSDDINSSSSSDDSSPHRAHVKSHKSDKYEKPHKENKYTKSSKRKDNY